MVSLEQHKQDLDELEESINVQEREVDELLRDPAMTQVNVKWFRSIRRWVSRAARSVARSVSRVAKRSFASMKAAAARAGQTMKKVGGKIVKVATSVFNKFVNKARSVASSITSAIRKIDLIKYVKTAVNKFFQVTESCTFEKVFKATVGRLMRAFGFSAANVNAAYKLLTRNFWKGQVWLFRWVLTAGPIRSFLAPSGGPDFAQGARFCNDFADTVNLGGKVMSKFYAFPQVVAASKIIIAKAIWTKQVVCRALSLAIRVRNIYFGIRNFLSKFGINLPIGRDAWRASGYNMIIGATRRCADKKRRSRRTRRYRR